MRQWRKKKPFANDNYGLNRQHQIRCHSDTRAVVFNKLRDCHCKIPNHKNDNAFASPAARRHIRQGLSFTLYDGSHAINTTAVVPRDRNKEKCLHVRRTCDHVRLTCPPIFSLVQKIMHRSTQNYKFRKTGTIIILKYNK